MEDKEEIIENEKEEEGKESSTTDTGKRSKPTAAETADATNAASERMEKANEKREELIVRDEALEAKKRLSGDAEAGGKAPEETEDEKWAKDAKERYAGTGMDPTPDKEDGKPK